MKIIFSRKGSDSSNLNIPSPMFKDGTLLSLPIPEEKINSLTYNDIQFNGKTFDNIISELSPKKKFNSHAHLDPDLRYNARKRESEKNIWQGLFGQWDVAQTILQKCGIGKDDIFLFFGWFREAIINANGTFCYMRDAPDIHAIWGYMQVESLIKTQQEYSDYAKNNPDIKNHQHTRYFEANLVNNCIYVARDKLSSNDKKPGYGLLKNTANGSSIILTENGKTRSNWKLPKDVFANVKFCSHKNNLFDSEVRWYCINRGQEFVIDCVKYPEV
jgi:hypothetical protein